MSLKTKVKAGNITNLSDARYCAGMGVDWLGFPASKVDPTQFKEITEWVTGPQFVLEANGLDSFESLSLYNVEIIQIDKDQLSWIDSVPGKSWMVALHLKDLPNALAQLRANQSSITQLIISLDGDNDVEASLRAIHNQIPVLIDFDGAATNLHTILALPVDGINISGGQELRPGLKDFDALAAVLEELEIVD